jgi:hypothetical protein
MVEIEIGVLAAQCLDRRIESIKQLAVETAIWEQQRNPRCPSALAQGQGHHQPADGDDGHRQNQPLYRRWGGESFFRLLCCGGLAVPSDRPAQHLGLPAFELLAAAEISPSNLDAWRKI